MLGVKDLLSTNGLVNNFRERKKNTSWHINNRITGGYNFMVTEGRIIKLELK